MSLQNCLTVFLIIGTVLAHIPQSFAARNNNEVQLESVKAELTDENQQKKRLKQRIEKIEAELTDIKNRLTDLGRSMRKNEDKLRNTQERIEKLEKRKAELTKSLEAERISIVKLILMLGRIRKTPPEIMIARPDTPYHTAQSALLMENIIPSVKRDAQRLMNNLETLNQLTVDLKAEREELKNEGEEWEKKRKELMTLVSEKERLYAKIDKDLKMRQLSINAISLKAKSLEDLIARIKMEEKQEIARQKQAKIFRRKPQNNILDSNNTAVQLPVSGIIRTSYHDKDEYGAKSNGLIIEGRSGGLVTAPISGKIQFIGSFKRFSNIIIIEHNGGYHSLIAGLGEINAVIGDIVKSGEPIGLLPDSALITRPKLYYELRKNGAPVNPSVKFSELG
ncbi:MAG: peptidoglycan DD-metalloendopeptidase family protein [Alphaproteobacteria bacterium]|nr:peptidoglycan DD-metalloendopeptidase family protein [Alphaproteobacteria bacterium]